MIDGIGEMKKVVDYTLLSAEIKMDLIENVKRHIDTGWQPLGGVSTTLRRFQYCQAMVKCECEE